VNSIRDFESHHALVTVPTLASQATAFVAVGATTTAHLHELFSPKAQEPDNDPI
jgi:hypothetical protein